MKILSFESSAVSASVCLTDDEKIIAESYQNCGLTHSRTLLPMAESLLAGCDHTLDDVDAFAIAAGPGSFTGLRIGVATVKGLAFATNKPCIGVSTLEAMAQTVYGENICCVMDARAGQVYQAFFKRDGETLTRLCEDRAIKLDELAEEIGQTSQILVGDGANLCYTRLTPICPNLCLAPEHLRYPSAYGVAKLALTALNNGKGVCANDIDAFYLRPPYIAQPKKTKIIV